MESCRHSFIRSNIQKTQTPPTIPGSILESHQKIYQKNVLTLYKGMSQNSMINDHGLSPTWASPHHGAIFSASKWLQCRFIGCKVSWGLKEEPWTNRRCTEMQVRIQWKVSPGNLFTAICIKIFYCYVLFIKSTARIVAPTVVFLRPSWDTILPKPGSMVWNQQTEVWKHCTSDTKHPS